MERCRICESTALWCFLDLGSTPLANALVYPGSDDREARYPLELLRCEECGLVQLSVVVRPEILFRDYAYSTSASFPMVEHFDGLAAEIFQRTTVANPFVLEVGSNDGTLLRAVARRGARVLGIEPATALARAATAGGVESLNLFFGSDVARDLLTDRGPADIMVANNVLAHIDDLPGVIEGVATLLSERGIFVAEFPYVLDTLERVEYDTVYHEHLSYLALAPLERALARHELTVFDIERISTHGGSLRIWVARAGARQTSAAVTGLADREQRAVSGRGPFERFAREVANSRDALRAMMSGLRSEGARIAGYGATAKSTTLLTYCGLGADAIEFIADSTPAKQGRLTPGTRIPIVPEEAIVERRPDYALLLAWNYAERILERSTAYLRGGGRFIHPIPYARIIP